MEKNVTMSREFVSALGRLLAIAGGIEDHEVHYLIKDMLCVPAVRIPNKGKACRELAQYLETCGDYYDEYKNFLRLLRQA